jgi:hypothetical protein
MCLVLFLFVTCFGWNFTAIVVAAGAKKEEGGGGCHSVEISPKACYKQKQNQTHYENITH